jgi:hypothetical protein
MAPPRCRPSTRAEEADSRPARELAAEAFGAQVVERAKALVCYGRLTALGAPRRLEFLNGEWRRCFSEPYISGRPHYVRSCVDESGCEFESHLFHADDHWYITPGAAGGGMVLCGARSDSLGPMTVDPKQWHHPTAGGSGALMPEFEFVVDGPNTEDEPFLMEVRPPPACAFVQVTATINSRTREARSQGGKTAHLQRFRWSAALRQGAGHVLCLRKCVPPPIDSCHNL